MKHPSTLFGATLALGLSAPVAATAQTATAQAKPDIEAPKKQPPKPIQAKPILQDFRDDYRFRHRKYKPTPRPLTVTEGEPFKKTVRLDGVGDGYARVLLPVSKGAARAPSAKRRAVGFYRLGGKAFPHKLKKHVGRIITVTLKRIGGGQLKMVDFELPKVKGPSKE